MSVDLTTTYLGMRLRTPVIVSACPLTGELDVLRRIDAAGCGAAVLPSLFEEQLADDSEQCEGRSSRDDSVSERHNYFRELNHYNRGVDVYLRHIEVAKKAVSMPIIASLNVSHADGWKNCVKSIASAGADALELNIHYFPADSQISGQEIELRYLDIITTVRNEIQIPLAVKVGPYFTAFAHLAERFESAGADGLVLFNQYLHPDVDLESLKVVPKLVLSSPDEARMALRWIAILRGRLHASLAATGGIHSGADAAKMLLVGADAVMVASVLYQRGIEYLSTLIDELRTWMARSDFDSVSRLQGQLSQARCADPAAFERAHYTKAISSFLERSL